MRRGIEVALSVKVTSRRIRVFDGGDADMLDRQVAFSVLAANIMPRSLPCPSSERTSLLLGGWSQAVAFLQRPGYRGVSSQVHKKGAPTAALFV